jgi:hypothetical protein
VGRTPPKERGPGDSTRQPEASAGLPLRSASYAVRDEPAQDQGMSESKHKHRPTPAAMTRISAGSQIVPVKKEEPPELGPAAHRVSLRTGIGPNLTAPRRALLQLDAQRVQGVRGQVLCRSVALREYRIGIERGGPKKRGAWRGGRPVRRCPESSLGRQCRTTGPDPRRSGSIQVARRAAMPDRSLWRRRSRLE